MRTWGLATSIGTSAKSMATMGSSAARTERLALAKTMACKAISAAVTSAATPLWPARRYAPPNSSSASHSIGTHGLPEAVNEKGSLCGIAR